MRATIAAFASPRLVFQYSWPKLREVGIYTVAQETLVGLSHRKGDPWRVDPFRATSRPRSGDRVMSIPVSGVRRHNRNKLCVGYKRGGRIAEACLSIVMSKNCTNLDFAQLPRRPWWV